MFIVYPQHGRVNAKAPKTRQSFTLHQFEKVDAAPLCQITCQSLVYTLLTLLSGCKSMAAGQ